MTKQQLYVCSVFGAVGSKGCVTCLEENRKINSKAHENTFKNTNYTIFHMSDELNNTTWCYVFEKYKC